MARKRAAGSMASCTLPKRQIKVMAIAEKVGLLVMLKARRSFAAVGYHYKINESTFRYIKKDWKKIQQVASILFNEEAKLPAIRLS